MSKHRKGKIFGIGLSKTGTTSLCAALERLGYRSGTYRHLERLGLGGWFAGDFSRDYICRYDALTDLPIGTFFRHLDHAYPGSKFILTVRDKQEWLQSCSRFFSEVRKTTLFYGFTMYLAYGAVCFDEDRFAETYDEHYRKVTEYFLERPNDLLIMNLFEGDSWGKLCAFLGESVPDEPFPAVKPGERLDGKAQGLSRPISSKAKWVFRAGRAFRRFR